VTDEEAFFGSLIACLIISVVLALASILGVMENDNAKKLVSFVFKFFSTHALQEILQEMVVFFPTG